MAGVFLAFCLAGATGIFAVPGGGAGTAPEALVINSIAVDGTNLVFSASVPPGIGAPGLEMRPALDAPWQELALSAAKQSSTNDWLLVIPKPDAPMAFFRLKAAPVNIEPATAGVAPIQNKTVIRSSEVKYALTKPLAAGDKDEAVFHFSGKVDGSDRIFITRDGALWSHLHWDWPVEAVTINGTKWDSREKNYLTAAPDKFLPDAFSLDSAHLEVIQGRDVVAMERTNDGLMIYINDLRPGAAPYDFKIHFHRAAAAASRKSGTPARLKIAGQIDGSDHVIITAQGALLRHQTWGAPQNMTLNGQPWPKNEHSYFPNLGDSKFLPDGVDLSTARVISRKGRDLAAMWAEAETVHVWFADNPNGSDYYELEIAFGE